MAMSTQEFAALLGRSYPDALNRAGEIKSQPGHLGFRSPNLYQDPLDRQAAAIGGLLEVWDRLDELDQSEATRLAVQDMPLATVYNFVDYRQNQTIVFDPVAGREDRNPPESSWQPYVEPPTRDPDALRAVASQTGRLVDAADQRTRPLRDLRAQPGAGLRPDSQGAVEHTGSRTGSRRDASRGL
jgi:hypothetical protein